MNIKEITEKYLKDNGHDGLCGEFCACGLDDLFWCAGKDDRPLSIKCVPAKSVHEGGIFYKPAEEKPE